jgi:hypothetical protein
VRPLPEVPRPGGAEAPPGETKNKEDTMKNEFRDDDLNRIFERERERGRGYPIGLDTDSVEEALRREGFEVIRQFGAHRGNAGVLARTPTGRYVLAADVYGPFAVDVPEV